MPPIEYLDFELNIELLPDGKLRVTLLNSPAGSATTNAVNPFTEDETRRIIGILDGSIRITKSDAVRTLRAFGEKLFTSLISGNIYAAYLTSKSTAGERGLRIKLGLENAGVLQEIPWELIRDPQNDYLTLSRQTPLVRYPRLLTVRPILDVVLPLRVLVMISSPTDQEELDVEGEWRDLQEATAELRARGLLQIDRVDNAQLNTLQRKLREGTNYQIFHYIGHATFDERTQSGALAFEDPRTNSTTVVSGEALARELSEENSIRLVVLNACQGARSNQADPFSGVASSIVARGIPAVVAMQFAISDVASRAFSQEFYRTISEGFPIEAAMAEARRAISNTLANFEWATPVLYLRAPSGLLFPRRRGGEASTITTSTGGLRDVLLRPVPMLLGLLMIAAVVFLLVNGRGRGDLGQQTPTGDGPQQVTLTPTVPGAKLNIDLALVSVRYLPAIPAPGQLTTISIRIENKGVDDSGRFSWAWFATDALQSSQPTLQGEVANLSPGTSITVRAEYRFPWWGTYATSAWVNFDNVGIETNIFNNSLPRNLTTSNNQFDIDLARRPSGEPIEPGPVSDGQFAAFNVSELRAITDANCTNGAPSIILNAAEEPRLRVAGASANCATLPITFKIAKPTPESPDFARVGINFEATVAGIYSLELLDDQGQSLWRETRNFNAGTTVQNIVAAPTNRAFSSVRAVFRGPNGATTSLQGIFIVLP
jgi:CHAT domain/CARDB